MGEMGGRVGGGLLEDRQMEAWSKLTEDAVVKLKDIPRGRRSAVS